MWSFFSQTECDVKNDPGGSTRALGSHWSPLISQETHWPWMGRPHCRDCWNCSRKCRNSLGWCRKQKVLKKAGLWTWKVPGSPLSYPFLSFFLEPKHTTSTLNCDSEYLRPTGLADSTTGSRPESRWHLWNSRRNPTCRIPPRSTAKVPLSKEITLELNHEISKHRIQWDVYVIIPLGFLQTLDEGKVKWTTWGKIFKWLQIGTLSCWKDQLFLQMSMSC